MALRFPAQAARAEVMAVRSASAVVSERGGMSAGSAGERDAGWGERGSRERGSLAGAAPGEEGEWRAMEGWGRPLRTAQRWNRDSRGDWTESCND